ncbi:MAG: hypothetical protein ACRDGS_01835 [Chloroflexota bacterium]
MRTDIPLKTLTTLRARDLLPLFGVLDATVVDVETLELPSSSTSLDTVLRLRDAGGMEYLHLVEWQGYHDPLFLWRAMGYLGWLGVHRQERPIGATLVYLHPTDDVGDRLAEEVAGPESWGAYFRVVRLWEHDAEAAVASGRTGLAVLSPLMRGASARLVEQAADVVLGQASSPRQQADLLSILSVFSEPLIDSRRLIQIVGKEQLMASDVLSILVEEKVAEARKEMIAEFQARYEQEQARLAEEQEQARIEQEQAELYRARVSFEDAVTDVLITRFPTVPVSHLATIREIHDVVRLQGLHHALLRAADQEAAEQILRQVR